jgi:hypothetical protein
VINDTQLIVSGSYRIKGAQMALTFFTKIFKRKSDSKASALFVTPDKLRELFDYGHHHGLTGLGLPEHVIDGVGRLIDWQPEPKDWTIRVDYKGYKIGDQIVIPSHIKWSNNPEFKYIGLEGDELQFRVGQSAYFLSDVTTDTDLIHQIDELFKFWYQHLQLPISPTSEVPAEFATTTGPVLLGFDVLSVVYPNHDTTSVPAYTAIELAKLLANEMETRWFAIEPAFEIYSVSEVLKKALGGENAFGFEFGPVHQGSDEFETSLTIIVRETSGGGFMLLMEKADEHYAVKISELFNANIKSGVRMQE